MTLLFLRPRYSVRPLGIPASNPGKKEKKKAVLPKKQNKKALELITKQTELIPMFDDEPEEIKAIISLLLHDDD